MLGAAANRNLTSLGQARSGISHANFVNNTADGYVELDVISSV